MSLESFIYHFGGGKIQLKYRLIEEKYSRLKRNLIEWVLVLAVIAQITLGVLLMNNQFWLLWFVLGALLMGGFEVWIFRMINRSVQTGMIYFHSDHMRILTNSEILISYKDITSVYFKFHMKSHRGSRYNHKWTAMSGYAYYIQVNTSSKSYTIKVENDLWLTDEDKMQFHRYYPLMMQTLEEIHNRYGTRIEEKPKKFKFEPA